MRTDLLQRLVVDKTGSIFGDLKLTLLDLLAKFPVERNYVSFLGGIIPGAGRGCVTTQQTSDLHIATQNPRANGSRGGRGVEKAEMGRPGRTRKDILVKAERATISQPASSLCDGGQVGGSKLWAAAPVRTTPAG